MFVPREEVELVVERGERFAYVLHSRFNLLVVDTGLASFVRGLEEYEAFGADGFLTSGDDFRGADGVVTRDGTELGDVQQLHGAASQGCTDENLRPVVKLHGFFVYGGSCSQALDGGADLGQRAVLWRGVFRQVVEVVEGELYFPELCLGIGQGSVDYTRVVVRGEEAGIQHANGHVCGDAELAHFEYVVTGVCGVVQFLLSPVHAESDEASGFVGYPIKVVYSPLGVCEEFP